jgi:hypothetical protein
LLLVSLVVVYLSNKKKTLCSPNEDFGPKTVGSFEVLSTGMRLKGKK